MNKTIPVAVLVVLLAFGSYYGSINNKNDLFEQWKKEFPIELNIAEEYYRRLIFMQNLQMVEKHNTDPKQTYKMAINQFSIYTQEEFKSRFLGEIISGKSNELKIDNVIQIPQSNIEIDWTTKGGVSRVKNQGSCGSCWSFSATGVCESWALVFKKATHDLSEQQLVDCSGSYGNHGCNGGSRLAALKYIKDHGLLTESQYPYKGITQSCKKNEGDFHIPSIKQVSGCSGLQNAISGRPVAVAVDAGGWSHYASGVFSNCGTSINHAVLLVGVVNGAWKIKNSWGTTWGEKGFIRLASGNTCGVCLQEGVFIQ